MGFVRDELPGGHLVLEQRRESFKIHATYPWKPEGQHIEIEYADLTALIADLEAIKKEAENDGITTERQETD